jgi:hypothetical protein
VPECTQCSYASFGVLYTFSALIFIYCWLKSYRQLKRISFVLVNCLSHARELWIRNMCVCEIDWISLHNLPGLFSFGLCSVSIHVMQHLSIDCKNMYVFNFFIYVVQLIKWHLSTQVFMFFYNGRREINISSTLHFVTDKVIWV